MSARKIYFYVLDTLADWEPGYALAELGSGRFFRPGAPRFEVVTVGRTREPIRTMGGVKIAPDVVLDEIRPVEGDVLLLPGAETWGEPAQAAVVALARAVLDRGVVVAAICGATVALADAGVLDDRLHTSNDLDHLRAACPGYRGASHYRHEPAVLHGNLITATGLAPRELAEKLFERLGVMSAETLRAWSGLHAERTRAQFEALVASLPTAR